MAIRSLRSGRESGGDRADAEQIGEKDAGAATAPAQHGPVAPLDRAVRTRLASDTPMPPTEAVRVVAISGSEAAPPHGTTPMVAWPVTPPAG